MTTLIPKVSLWALLPIVIFLILTLRGKNYTLSVGIASILGCLLTLQGPLQFADMLVKNLGSTLGQVGLIIMFGAGLGNIMEASGINKIIAAFVVDKVGVDSEKKQLLLATWFLSSWSS